MTCAVTEMSILKYLHPKDGLPDPHGSLLSIISPCVTFTFTSCKIQSCSSCQYRCYHGVANRCFSRQLGWQVSECTIRSIKREEVRNKRKAHDEGDITVLPCKKRGSDQFYLVKHWIVEFRHI